MDLESHLLALADAEGLLAPGDREARLPEDPEAPSALWGPAIAALLARGRLDRAWVEARARDFLRKAPPEEDGEPGWMVHTSPGLPSSLGRYQHLRLVAVGGQGRVYHARDALLDRDVALKFLRWESPLQREWLIREGRAQAKAVHPGICPVHEVGELGGEAYLALAWIDGPPFASLLPELSRRDRLDLLVQACEAVGAAHGQGLVHLDLKPGNLLVSREGGGRWQVRVSDFGLAWRAGEATEGSRGTPPYASPEQMRPGGARPGPTCDVYALGVLLHLALAGRLPADPGPGALDAEASRVFARATALDPDRRHPDAASLAEDLRALRDGRPLPGRRTPPWRRLRLWSRRRPAAAAALALGAGLLGMAGLQAVRFRIQAREEARAARRFGEELRDLEALLQVSGMSPPHDRGPTLAKVRARMAAIRDALGALGPEAAREGWYTLGRAHQLLGEDPEALEALERAWARGLQTPECAQALGLARAMAFLDAARGMGLDLQQAASASALAGLRDRYALPAAGLLAQASPAGADAPRVLAALRAELEGRGEDAEALAREALHLPPDRPWEVQPWRVLALYWEYRAQVHLGRHVLDLARQRLDLARAAADRAVEAARSDASLRLTRGWLLLTEAHLAELEGDVPRAGRGLAEAEATFLLARRLQPDLLLARKYHLDALRRQAVLARHHGPADRKVLDRALEGLRAAEAEGREDAGLQNARRRLLREALAWAWSGGGALEGPETERLRRALRTAQSPSAAARDLAQLDLDLAAEAQRRGADPLPFLEASRGPLASAHHADPQDLEALLAWTDWNTLRAGARPEDPGLPARLEVLDGLLAGWARAHGSLDELRARREALKPRLSRRGGGPEP